MVADFKIRQHGSALGCAPAATLERKSSHQDDQISEDDAADQNTKGSDLDITKQIAHRGASLINLQAQIESEIVNLQLTLNRIAIFFETPWQLCARFGNQPHHRTEKLDDSSQPDSDASDRRGTRMLPGTSFRRYH